TGPHRGICAKRVNRPVDVVATHRRRRRRWGRAVVAAVDVVAGRTPVRVTCKRSEPSSRPVRTRVRTEQALVSLQTHTNRRSVGPDVREGRPDAPRVWKPKSVPKIFPSPAREP